MAHQDEIILHSAIAKVEQVTGLTRQQVIGDISLAGEVSGEGRDLRNLH